MPNSVPEAMPISAWRENTDSSRLRQLMVTCATEISMTPTTLMAMAASAPCVTRSPRKISPKSAACAGSVREYAVPTAKLRKENRWMSRKVAPIWLPPPTTDQARKVAFGCGSG